MAITGLIDGDDGWVDWNGGDDKVWLEISFNKWPDDYDANICSESNGDDFGDGEFESNGGTPPTQTFARVVLATISDDGNGNPVVDQRVRTHLQMTADLEADGDGVVMDCRFPVAFPSNDVLPEWMGQSGNFDDGYAIWMGDGTASFGSDDEEIAPIGWYAIEVQDPNDDTASAMSLLVGDDDQSNDMLCFTYTGDAGQNEVYIQWTDYPEILLCDDGEDEENANQVNLNIEDGPEVYLQDGTGNEITVNINDTSSGGDVTSLTDGDLQMPKDGTIEIGDEGSITVGKSVLSDGDLDLGDDGTIEIGDSGSITVGASVLSDGDLDLGASGSLETDTIDTTGDVTIGGDLDVTGDGSIGGDLDVTGDITCSSLDADSITYGGEDLDSYIDDSIRTALDSLSASIDCDSMSVTFSYSY